MRILRSRNFTVLKRYDKICTKEMQCSNVLLLFFSFPGSICKEMARLLILAAVLLYAVKQNAAGGEDPRRIRINEVNIRDIARVKNEEFIELHSLEQTTTKAKSLQGYALYGISGIDATSPGIGATIQMCAQLWNEALQPNGFVSLLCIVSLFFQ